MSRPVSRGFGSRSFERQNQELFSERMLTETDKATGWNVHKVDDHSSSLNGFLVDMTWPDVRFSSRAKSGVADGGMVLLRVLSERYKSKKMFAW